MSDDRCETTFPTGERCHGKASAMHLCWVPNRSQPGPEDKVLTRTNCVTACHVRRVELGPRNPVLEAWFDDDGSISIGNVQHNRMVDGVCLAPEHAKALREAIEASSPTQKP